MERRAKLVKKKRKKPQNDDVSAFKFQWPEIECVYCMDPVTWWHSDIVWVTEKLDGSNMCISSSGMVCSRRKILVEPDSPEDLLKKTKFAGFPLTTVESHLSVNLPDLKSFLCENFKIDLDVLVYGEWINKGTSSSSKDLYGYHKRGISPGTFHSFGMGLIFQDQELQIDQWAERLGLMFKSYPSEENTEYHVFYMTKGLFDLLSKFELNPIPILLTCKVEDVFRIVGDRIAKEEVEGVVVSSRKSTWKWKNKSVDSDPRHESRLEVIEQSLNGNRGVVECLWNVIVPPNHSNLDGLYFSARSKYPHLCDTSGNEDFDLINKLTEEMFNDLPNALKNGAEKAKISNFVKSKIVTS